MIETEDILFVMPRDHEMQFPAMAALQMYVNNYQVKMQCNCVLPEPPAYEFRYKVDMPEEDWDFFQAMGIELKQQPVDEIGIPEQVIELTDDRLLHFQNSAKHCAQICAAITGVEAPPYPVVKRVELKEFSRWLLVAGDLAGLYGSKCFAEHLLIAGVASAVFVIDEWVGGHPSSIDTPIVIGMQGRQTYAACTLGLPVIEILPKRRTANWLSKWQNQLYRMVEEDQLDRVPAAIENLKATMAYIVAKKAAVS